MDDLILALLSISAWAYNALTYTTDLLFDSPL